MTEEQSGDGFSYKARVSSQAGVTGLVVEAFRSSLKPQSRMPPRDSRQQMPRHERERRRTSAASVVQRTAEEAGCDHRLRRLAKWLRANPNPVEKTRPKIEPRRRSYAVDGQGPVDDVSN